MQSSCLLLPGPLLSVYLGQWLECRLVNGFGSLHDVPGPHERRPLSNSSFVPLFDEREHSFHYGHDNRDLLNQDHDSCLCSFLASFQDRDQVTSEKIWGYPHNPKKYFLETSWPELTCKTAVTITLHSLDIHNNMRFCSFTGVSLTGDCLHRNRSMTSMGLPTQSSSFSRQYL